MHRFWIVKMIDITGENIVGLIPEVKNEVRVCVSQGLVLLYDAIEKLADNSQTKTEREK